MKAKTKSNIRIIIAGIVFIALAFVGVQYMSIQTLKTSDIFTISEISSDGFMVEGYNPVEGKFKYYIECPSTTAPDEECVRTQIVDGDGNHIEGSEIGCLIGGMFNVGSSYEDMGMRYLLVIDQGKNESPVEVKLYGKYSEYSGGSDIKWSVNQVTDIETLVCTHQAYDRWGYGQTYLTHSDKEKFILQLTSSGSIRIQFIEPYASRTYCGNGVCDSTETWQNCPEDCATEEIERLEGDLERQIEIIEEMEATMAQKAEYINQLTSNLNEQSEIINAMELQISEKVQLIEELTTNLNEQAVIINNLDVSIGEKQEIIGQLTDVTSEQASIINNLNLNLQEKAMLITGLVTENEIQAELINEMGISFDNQKELIKAMNQTIQEDAILISGLNLTEGEKALLIQELSTSLEEEKEFVRNLEVEVSEQGVIIANLNMALQDEYDLIDSLNLKIEEQAEIIANLKLTIEREKELVRLLSGGDEDKVAELERLIDREKEQEFPILTLIAVVLVIAIIVVSILWRGKKK